MNRRDFLRALGLTASTCALSPLLDLAPIELARSVVRINITDNVGLGTPSPAIYLRIMSDGTLRKSAVTAIRDFPGSLRTSA